MPVRDLLFAASTQGAAPEDPDFEYVTLLLNGDGTNGAQNNTFLDSSTNNFTITRNGNTTQGSFSPYGNLWSNYFSNTSYLITPQSSSFTFTGNFTIECWVNLQSISSFVDLIATANNQTFLGSGQSGWSLGISPSTGQLNFSYQTSNSFPFANDLGIAITLNTWCHVAVVRNGSTITGYVNGVAGTTPITSSATLTSSTYGVHIGAGAGNAGLFATGYVSNARVGNTAVYTSAFTPSVTPLTAISGTQLLTCQSNRFVDNSSSARAITTSGTPSVQRFSPFEPTAPYSTSVIGGSGYFDGSGDYLSVASNSAFGYGTGDFEISFWFYKQNATDAFLIDQRTADTQAAVCLYITSSTVRLYVSGADRITSSSISLNTWYYLTVSRVSGITKMFLNGSQTGSDYSDSTNYIDSPVVFCVRAIDLSSSPLNGYMSNVRIIKGSGVTSQTVPTAPLTAISGTSLLANMVNAGIPDLAMQNNLETVGNAQVSTSVKKYGTGSLAFDGTGDSLLTPSSPLVSSWVGNFTIEGWVYANISSTTFYIWTNSTGNNDGFTGGYIYTDGSVGLGKFGVNEIATSTGLVTSNTWVHIAFVGDGGTVYIYVNGVSSASGSQATYMSTDVKPLTFGRNYNNTPTFSTGNIDDFRITKGVARYPSGTTFTPPTAALPTF